MSKVEDKRAIIVAHVVQHGRITKSEAVQLVGSTYYCNADKHVGDILSRLVNVGVLIREKPGVFVVGSLSAKGKRSDGVKNHPELF